MLSPRGQHRACSTSAPASARSPPFSRQRCPTPITGIDIAERPLRIARRRLTEVDPQLAGRVRLRHQDVTELDEDAHYDVVWMPLPFIPDAIVERALDRATAALRPGGLLVLGTNPDLDDPLEKAAGDWIASLANGGTLATSDVERRLQRRGLAQIGRFATVPGGPVIVAGLVPER